MSRCADFDGDRGRVEDLIGGDAGERAAGYVADYVTAGALGERPMESSASTTSGRDSMVSQWSWMFWRDGDVGEIAGVLARDAADDAQLMRSEDAVGNADAHHEVFGGQALAALAAGGAHAVALGVDAPPLEVDGGPLGHHAGAAIAGKCAHFIEGFPRILLALEAFTFWAFVSLGGAAMVMESS